ncbi:MAG: signal peptidase II [Gammaproteobacteria bacterium]
MKKNWIWFVVAVLLIICDQASKLLALETLPIYSPIRVFPGLNWTLMFNSGSAFGFLNQSNVWWYSYVFTGFGLLMSLGLIIWMILCKPKEKIELFALACILSGALGNVIDRLRFGHVIDFIQIYWYDHYFPVFNIADSAICIGAVLLFITGHKKTVQRKKNQSKH